MDIHQIKKIENLELLARQVVEGYMIGLHKSPFHGYSVEFAEHRLYNPGDPLRHIDWRVYGRTDKWFVKKFEEETNLRAALVLDCSSSMLFPPDAEINKLRYACLCAAAILYLLRRQLDASALALFDETLFHLTPCRSTYSHYQQILHTLEETLDSQARGRPTRAAEALHQIAERMPRRSLIILFSDFLEDDDSLEASLLALQHLKFQKHEVIVFHMTDVQREIHLEYERKPYEFIDLETGIKTRLLPHELRQQYREHMESRQKMIAEKCHQYRIDFVPIDLRESPREVLAAFLSRRNKMV